MCPLPPHYPTPAGSQTGNVGPNDAAVASVQPSFSPTTTTEGRSIVGTAHDKSAPFIQVKQRHPRTFQGNVS